MWPSKKLQDYERQVPISIDDLPWYKSTAIRPADDLPRGALGSFRFIGTMPSTHHYRRLALVQIHRQLCA